MIPGGENFLSLDDDSVAWLLAQEERHKFRFRRCDLLWGTLAVNTEYVQQQWVTTSSCGLLISCDMIVIRSAVVFGLFFSGEQKINNIVVYYSRYVVVDTWYENKTIIVLLWPYNRMVRLAVRLFIMFPSVVNMEF